jgi:hypothetical protein
VENTCTCRQRQVLAFSVTASGGNGDLSGRAVLKSVVMGGGEVR